MGTATIRQQCHCCRQQSERRVRWMVPRASSKQSISSLLACLLALLLACFVASCCCDGPNDVLLSLKSWQGIDVRRRRRAAVLWKCEYEYVVQRCRSFSDWRVRLMFAPRFRDCRGSMSNASDGRRTGLDSGHELGVGLNDPIYVFHVDFDPLHLTVYIECGYTQVECGTCIAFCVAKTNVRGRGAPHKRGPLPGGGTAGQRLGVVVVFAPPSRPPLGGCGSDRS